MVGIELSVVPWLAQEDHDATEKLADDHTEIGKTTNTFAKSVDLLEDNGIGSHEEVEQTVDEGHVYTQGQDDRFGEQDLNGPSQVLLQQFSEVNLDLFLLGVNAPVLGPPTQLRCFLDEYDGRVRLFHEEEIQNKSGGAHDARQILGPAPAQIAFYKKATDERGEQRTVEDGHGKNSDGNASGTVAEDVRKDSGNHRDWTGPEETTEEAAEHNRLEVLCRRHRELEQGEAKHTDDDRQPSAVKLRHRSPQDRAGRKAEHIQG